MRLQRDTVRMRRFLVAADNCPRLCVPGPSTSRVRNFVGWSRLELTYLEYLVFPKCGDLWTLCRGSIYTRLNTRLSR